MRALSPSILLLLAALPGTVLRGEAEDPVMELPGGIQIFPHLHVHGAAGGSTGEVEDLAAGAHDPREEGFNLQGIEAGLSLRAWEHLEGFAVYNVFLDGSDDLDGELEEAFGKLVNLPFGLEFRGGRFLNRFGLHNPTHLHGWDFIDDNLATARFLGEEGLVTDGGEVLVAIPNPWNEAFLSFSYGKALAHEEHGEHGEHEEHGDHDGEEDEAEGALFSEEFFNVNVLKEFVHNDFHVWRTNASAAWGNNELGSETQIYGLGLQYQWRENGFEEGGRAFRWRSEVFYREIGRAAKGDLDEWGGYTAVVFDLNDRLGAALRLGLVEGVDELELGERWRISPAVTFRPFGDQLVRTRLQYNYDDLEGAGDEHSLWLQVGFNWGGAEVR